MNIFDPCDFYNVSIKVEVLISDANNFSRIFYFCIIKYLFI